jgi:hypothetical protein
VCSKAVGYTTKSAVVSLAMPHDTRAFAPLLRGLLSEGKRRSPAKTRLKMPQIGGCESMQNGIDKEARSLSQQLSGLSSDDWS